VVRAAPRVHVIGRYGMAVDDIAVEMASASGIRVTGVPRYVSQEPLPDLGRLVAENVAAVSRAPARRWSSTRGARTRPLAPPH
jgi:hypothetical protein